MKNFKPFIIVVILFLLVFFYLHQKVQIYAEAYKLSKTSHSYNELVDKRDCLMYNFNQEVSLSRLNQWAENNDFAPVGKERLLAFSLTSEGLSGSKNRTASLFSRILGISTGSSEAMAENGKHKGKSRGIYEYESFT